MSVDLETLSAQLHDVYQQEAHRRGDVRHADVYADLSEDTKEWDRVLARWILANFTPRSDPSDRTCQNCGRAATEIVEIPWCGVCSWHID